VEADVADGYRKGVADAVGECVDDKGVRQQHGGVVAGWGRAEAFPVEETGRRVSGFGYQSVWKR